MKFTDETLMAYADGELDASTRAALEAAMASNSELAHRVASHRALAERLRGAFEPVLREPVPERLVAALRGTPSTQAPVTNIVDARTTRSERTRRRWSWPEFGSIAASLAVGLIVGRMLLASPDPLTTRDGNLYASGSLAAALSNQLANKQTDHGPVRIGFSFRAKAGDYCRTFAFEADRRLAGLACRDRDEWRVDVLARNDATQPGGGQYSQAGTALPETVLRAVDASIAGEPLDAAGEAAAMQHRWRK
jgi:hypothetical protein